MAIKKSSVQDLPEEVRREGAEAARARIRQLLSNPFLTSEQIALLYSKLDEITAWERQE